MNVEDKNPERRLRRPVVVMTRRAGVVAAWAVTVVLAFLAGWFADELGWRAGRPMAHGSMAPADAAIASVDPAPENVSQPEAVVAPTPAPTPKPVSTPASAPAQKAPADPLTLEPPVVESGGAEQDVEVVVPITEGFGRAVDFADAGDFEAARAEADALVDEYGDYSTLVAAFGESGSDEMRSRLAALRVLHLGGLDSVSTELARELKRSYAGTPEVLRSIHDWRILKPRVARLDSAIEGGAGIVVRGVIENPDIGVVRRVIVEIEALDAAGNVLATTTSRVRPRSLDPGAEGAFTAQFGDLDPDSVIRTRATVVKWKSEVLGRG